MQPFNTVSREECYKELHTSIVKRRVIFLVQSLLFTRYKELFIYTHSWPLYIYILYSFEIKLHTNLWAFTEFHLLATNWTALTSFHPFIYTAKVKMVRALCCDFRIFGRIFIKTCGADIFIFRSCLYIS